MRIELSHDALAAKIFDKVSTDEKALRKVEKFVRDRYQFYEARKTLLTQDELDYIRPWEDQLDLQPEEREFVNKSKQKALRRRIIFFGSLAAIFLFLVLSLIYVNGLRSEAWRQKELADEAKNKAIKAQDEAILAQVIADDERCAADAARDSAEVARDQAEEQRSIAIYQARVARLARDSAQEARDSAEAAKDAALAARAREEVQRKEAEEAREKFRQKSLVAYLLTAQTLAAKSLQTADPQLRGLLAQTAYNYHQKYGGPRHDRMIYDALYFARRSFEGPEFNTLSREGNSAHRKAIRSLAFSNDGRYLYSNGGDGDIVRWDLGSGQNIVMHNRDDILRTLSIDEQSNFLVSTGQDPTLSYFNISQDSRKLEAPEPTHLEVSHRAVVFDLEAIPGSNSFVAVGDDNQLRRYHLREGELIGDSSLYQLDARIKDLSVNNNGLWVAGAAEDGMVYIWSLDDTVRRAVEIPNLDAGIALISVSFSHNGQLLVSGDDRGRLHILRRRAEGDYLWESTLLGHSSGIEVVAFCKGDSLLATAGFDQQLLLREVVRRKGLLFVSEEPPIVCRDQQSYIRSMAFSPDGNIIAVGHEDGHLKLWPTRMRELAEPLCQDLDRSMTKAEMLKYIGNEEGMDYICTCPAKNDCPSISEPKIDFSSR